MPLLDTVSSITTMTIREVVQFGMISNIHMRAAKMKIAIILCCTDSEGADRQGPEKNCDYQHERQKYTILY